MFLISDRLDDRQESIRDFLTREPMIAVILAAADFEWTVRRAILALGCSSTSDMRRRWKERRLSGLMAYQREWKKEVTPRTGTDLERVVLGWSFFADTAFQLRHELVHGRSGTTGADYAERAVNSILDATKAVAKHVELHGESVYGKPIRRFKART